jgi:glycosyltransferase involved in cell wall biosynthesis
MKQASVSVIIPAYNGERFIRETVNSALNQDYKDYEIIIVDDGSTDTTLDILASFNSPLLHVFSEDHAGCVANYNRCLHHASGEYIAILDHDDIMLPERLSSQAAYLNANPNIAMVGSAYEVIDEDGIVLEHKPMPVGFELVRKFAMVFNAVQHPTAMYRRSLVDSIGQYDESWYPSHDSEFILRAIQEAGADNIPEVLTRWRKVASSPTNTRTAEQRDKHYKMRHIANTAVYEKQVLQPGKQESAMNLGKIAYYAGYRTESLKWFRRAMGHGLLSFEVLRYLFAATLMPLVKWMRKRNIDLPFVSSLRKRSANWKYYSP